MPLRTKDRLVRVQRGNDGWLGLGLNDFNVITELSESAKACGLELLDTVSVVDGVPLLGQKMQAVLATLPMREAYTLRVRRASQAKREKFAARASSTCQDEVSEWKALWGSSAAAAICHQEPSDEIMMGTDETPPVGPVSNEPSPPSPPPPPLELQAPAVLELPTAHIVTSPRGSPKRKCSQLDWSLNGGAAPSSPAKGQRPLARDSAAQRDAWAASRLGLGTAELGGGPISTHDTAPRALRPPARPSSSPNLWHPSAHSDVSDPAADLLTSPADGGRHDALDQRDQRQQPAGVGVPAAAPHEPRRLERRVSFATRLERGPRASRLGESDGAGSAGAGAARAAGGMRDPSSCRPDWAARPSVRLSAAELDACVAACFSAGATAGGGHDPRGEPPATPATASRPAARPTMPGAAPPCAAAACMAAASPAALPAAAPPPPPSLPAPCRPAAPLRPSWVPLPGAAPAAAEPGAEAAAAAAAATAAEAAARRFQELESYFSRGVSAAPPPPPAAPPPPPPPPPPAAPPAPASLLDCSAPWAEYGAPRAAAPPPRAYERRSAPAALAAPPAAPAAPPFAAPPHRPPPAAAPPPRGGDAPPRRGAPPSPRVFAALLGFGGSTQRAAAAAPPAALQPPAAPPPAAPLAPPPAAPPAAPLAARHAAAFAAASPPLAESPRSLLAGAALLRQHSSRADAAAARAEAIEAAAARVAAATARAEVALAAARAGHAPALALAAGQPPPPSPPPPTAEAGVWQRPVAAMLRETEALLSSARPRAAAAPHPHYRHAHARLAGAGAPRDQIVQSV